MGTPPSLRARRQADVTLLQRTGRSRKIPPRHTPCTLVTKRPQGMARSLCWLPPPEETSIMRKLKWLALTVLCCVPLPAQAQGYFYREGGRLGSALFQLKDELRAYQDAMDDFVRAPE